DSLIGRAAFYDLRRSEQPITFANFGAATPVSGEPAPLPPGIRQGMTAGGLFQGTRYYFALKIGDERPNWSGLSNVVERRTNRIAGDAKLLVHVTTPVSKAPCTNGRLADCMDVVDRGDLASVGGSGPRYFVYLLAAEFNELAGIQCGISYDSNLPDGDVNQRGIDVFGWSLCANLEVPSTSGPQWPKPGSSNVITWNSTYACQLEATAVAGYFYMAAYSPDSFQITPHSVDGLARVTNCAAVHTMVSPNHLGTARFSDGAALPGNNPCGVGQEIGIQPTTWSRIKTLTAK
ncbi:MAG TPA: hypothetical protein VF720_06880, partial [Candidatus Eisenbacteria bacterium]